MWSNIPGAFYTVLAILNGIHTASLYPKFASICVLNDQRWTTCLNIIELVRIKFLKFAIPLFLLHNLHYVFIGVNHGYRNNTMWQIINYVEIHEPYVPPSIQIYAQQKKGLLWLSNYTHLQSANTLSLRFDLRWK